MAGIFKTYDIRGVYPTEINEELAFKIGKATATFLKAKILVVGEDARTSSPSLRQKLIEGITSVGCDVISIGLCTTPLFYFSASQLKVSGGVMVTASHNPPDNNGFKIVGVKGLPIAFNNGLADIEKLSMGNFDESARKGLVNSVDIKSLYLMAIIKKSGWVFPDDRDKVARLKMVIDAGNCMTPLVVKPLMKELNLDFIPLFFELDCTFPNHSPDVSKVESLEKLSAEVVKQKADIGFAFDGDGDRIAVVDANGEVVRPDYILALLFKYGSGLLKKPKVAYDFRFSKSVEELLSGYGVPMRVGHSIIKLNMRKLNLDIGGELSGHFFFKEMNYAESTAFAMMKILKIVASNNKPLAELIKPFQKYYHSGEINLEISQDSGQKERRVQTLKEKYKDGKISELDGIKVDYWDKNPTGQKWWFNIRASNTQPLLRLVIEADTEELMKEKVAELRGLIEKFK